MPVYTDNLEAEVRLEYMRPEQIDAARARQPTIYLPFGALEWHGYHNPVGLDGLKAHEQLVGLAAHACNGRDRAHLLGTPDRFPGRLGHQQLS